MVVALGQLDLELDPPEERRRRVEDEAVGPGLAAAELADAAVGVRLAGAARAPRPRQSSTRTPDAGRPCSVSRTWVETVTARLYAGSRAAAIRCSRAISASSAFTSAPPRTTSFPATISRSTRCGPAKTRPATGSAAPAELEAVHAPDREVGTLPRLEAADVGAAEGARAASRREPQGLARGHRAGPAAAAGDEERLLHLEEQVAPLVRRRPVDPEPDVDPGVDELAHRRDARAEPEVRGGAVRDPDAVRPEPLDLLLERWMQWAHQTSSPSQPTRSR